MSDASQPDPLLGRTIDGRYEINRLIARGGMGKVYGAIQKQLGRTVAVKILDPSQSGENKDDFNRRFFLEASISARLRHPNTVTVFDYGQTEDGLYFMAMELLEGRTLHHEMKVNPCFPAERVVKIGIQVARSIREAHDLNFVHRDLKPANVFLVEHHDQSDFVKVLDFGLVKNFLDDESGFTKTGIFMGSPGYMSPEQIRSNHVDGRADVYSIGAIMFEMLTGRQPFSRDSAMDTILAHLNDSIPKLTSVNPNINVPAILEDVIRKALAKDREERFENIEGFIRALKAVAENIGGPDALGTHSVISSGRKIPEVPPPAPVASSAFSTSAFQGEGADDEGLQSAPTPSMSGILDDRRFRIAATTFIVVIVTAGIMFGVGGEAPQEQAKPAPTKSVSNSPPPDVDALKAQNDESVAPPEASVKFAALSTPSGARLAVGDTTICNQTPCDVELPESTVRDGQEVTFIFSKNGYENAVVVLSNISSSTTLSAELVALTPVQKVSPVESSVPTKRRGTSARRTSKPTPPKAASKPKPKPKSKPKPKPVAPPKAERPSESKPEPKPQPVLELDLDDLKDNPY